MNWIVFQIGPTGFLPRYFGGRDECINYILSVRHKGELWMRPAAIDEHLYCGL